MNKRFKTGALGISAAAAIGFGASASAQIPGDAVKIGLITDMSGVYSDISDLC